MPKNIEDIIVPDKNLPAGRQGRSIRDIPIPEGRRKSERLFNDVFLKKPALAATSAGDDYSSLPPRQNPNLPRGGRTSRKRVWMAVGVTGLVLLFAILSMFDGATFAYVPKSATLSFDNEVYTAQKTGAGGLFYSVVKLSREQGLVAPVSEEEPVSRKALGVIIVYNNASTESQRFVENTRFESPSGKIYRIQKAITIPGKKTVAGVSAPGTIEVTVYADQPGESYNAGLTDFTVPGLKGTAHYSTIYARSKTPISGGLVGLEKVVKQEELTKTKAELQTALRAELWQEVQAEVPEDFILFPSLSSFTFEDRPQTSVTGSSNSVTVNVRGNLYVIMFKKSDLSNYLASKKLTIATGELVDIPSFDSLMIAFTTTPPADLLPLNEISFKVTGSTTVLWRTDEVALRADLSGRHKRDVPAIIKNYPTMVSASATVRPFWKTSLPAESEKISIKKLSVE